MEAWLGLIGAIAGSIVGWGLSETTKLFTERRKAVRDLKTAAFVCLDRLFKIQRANSRSNDKQLKHELYLLGGDLDRYRDRIAASPKLRNKHWSVYCQMIPLLLEHDLTALGKVIAELEIVSGAGE